MQRGVVSTALVVSCLAASVGGSIAVAAARTPRTGRIAGDVRVCNAPGHCLTRKFTVSALDSAGNTVAKAKTKSADNAYRLRLSPGHYKLVAKSNGLVCRGSATAVAGQTTRRNIICLVP